MGTGDPSSARVDVPRHLSALSRRTLCRRRTELAAAAITAQLAQLSSSLFAPPFCPPLQLPPLLVPGVGVAVARGLGVVALPLRALGGEPVADVAVAQREHIAAFPSSGRLL